MRVFEADLRVLAHQRGSQRTQLGEHLDTGEPAADDDDGQQTVALGSGGERGRLVEVRHDLVADRDGFLDGLQPDRVVGDARDREGAGDGSRG